VGAGGAHARPIHRPHLLRPGGIFSFTSVSEKWKIAVVTLPFVMLLVDFGARALAKIFPGIVYLMLGSGAAIGNALRDHDAGPAVRDVDSRRT